MYLETRLLATASPPFIAGLNLSASSPRARFVEPAARPHRVHERRLGRLTGLDGKELVPVSDPTALEAWWAACLAAR